MSLSGGQRQRITVALATMSKATIIFLDEPTSGLDGENMKSVCSMLKDLVKLGKLIFVISHDIEFCLTLAEEYFTWKRERSQKISD